MLPTLKKLVSGYAPSVSVAHASAKAWKLGLNLHAKSSGLAKVEFSAILLQEYKIIFVSVRVKYLQI